MIDTIDAKYRALVDSLTRLNRVAVAFSGGVDSALLLHAAHEALGDSVLAITAHAPLFPERELDEAVSFCKQRDIRQLILDVPLLEDAAIRQNPPDRCYLCKSKLLGAIVEAAREHGFGEVVEGSNVDDESDYRPGSRAIAELGVRSSLKEAGLTKREIRELSKMHGLPTWDKQSFACLATRFAFGDELTSERLAMVRDAEQLLIDLGFHQVRVRLHGLVARIELLPKEMPRMLDPSTRTAVDEGFAKLGFTYATLDLRGYQTGSMNAGALDR